MTPEEKQMYKRLSRQVNEAYDSYIHKGKKAKPNLFNNRLRRMKEFLSNLAGDYSKNRYMICEFLENRL